MLREWEAVFVSISESKTCTFSTDKYIIRIDLKRHGGSGAHWTNEHREERHTGLISAKTATYHRREEERWQNFQWFKACSTEFPSEMAKDLHIQMLFHRSEIRKIFSGQPRFSKSSDFFLLSPLVKQFLPDPHKPFTTAIKAMLNVCSDNLWP